MKDIKSKVLYKDGNSMFYYCNCCDRFFLKYQNMAWKIFPRRFSEFYQIVSTINESYLEGLKPNFNNYNYSEEIKSLLNLNEEQLNDICEILDSIIIDIKRIVLEINFVDMEAKEIF